MATWIADQTYPQAQNWTLEALKSSPDRRFMKSHANLKDLPVGSAKGLKVRTPRVVFDLNLTCYDALHDRT